MTMNYSLSTLLTLIAICGALLALLRTIADAAAQVDPGLLYCTLLGLAAMLPIGAAIGYAYSEC